MDNGLWQPVSVQNISTDRPKRESMPLEEATISNMWEITAILEVLEREGLRLGLWQRSHPSDSRQGQVQAHFCRCALAGWNERQSRTGLRGLGLVVPEVCARG